jgi:hypothetical protein
MENKDMVEVPPALVEIPKTKKPRRSRNKNDIPEDGSPAQIILSPNSDGVHVYETPEPDISVVEEIIDSGERFKVECDETLMVEQPHSNRGRPAVPAHLKRVQIRGAYRIPQWLADWVMKGGDAGKKIEEALISHFKLIAPTGERTTARTTSFDYEQTLNMFRNKTS